MRLHSPKTRAFLLVRDHVDSSVTRFLRERKFVLVPTPVLSPSTDDAPHFTINYYGTKALLGTSSQFYTEAGLMAFPRVFSMAPAFRREPVNRSTPLHFTEFGYLHLEIANANCAEVMNTIEDLLATVVEDCNSQVAAELKLLGRRISPPRRPFRQIKFDSVYPGVRNEKEFSEISHDATMKFSHNLTEPVWIVNWPASVKDEIYYKRDAQNKDITMCFDLIYPEGFGEGSSGGERETDYQTLLSKSDLRTMTRCQWYLQMFKLGLTPHSGCGIGLERMFSWVSGQRNLKRILPFYRDQFNIAP
jgi:asparaginyl-tRNA synthetase